MEADKSSWSGGRPILVILAAGMGSRYGGLKQFEAVGPSGECLLDYSVFDAARSNFGGVVYVVRPGMETTFEEHLALYAPKGFPYRFAFQRIGDVPPKAITQPERSKPWGTAHAVWCAREWLTAPFAVINADDFYGHEAFAALGDFLSQPHPTPLSCMVGYRLGDTLSEGGSVSRGVCTVDGKGLLTSIEEHTALTRKPNSSLVSSALGEVSEEAVVSMNCWGFTGHFNDYFDRCVADYFAQPLEMRPPEFYLPTVVSRSMEEGFGPCQTLPGGKGWCGVTYPSDREGVVARIASLVDKGTYPKSLKA